MISIYIITPSLNIMKNLISKIKKEKKNSLKEEPHVRYRTDEELDHIMNDFGGEDILDDERIV